ncbi:MAG: 1-acyl-sn-glycerol-3-phosphate acyltransferase [Gammaproteobacteria bacterium]|nr:1-acyl-sn-glycerol-3-phosphate acyltransferase [Gammaproteobacteria bacterium]
MAFLFSFTLLYTIKLLALIFYRFDVNWLSEKTVYKNANVRLMVLLNHTSLFEPLFVRLAPHSMIKDISTNLIAPGADITIQRPIVGKLFRSLLPGIIPISRKRDDSWNNFLKKIDSDSFVAILPEGRMRRKDGNDKFGKPMTVRGGVADILNKLNQGDLLFVYSGGLHHVQIPGQTLPKIFQTIKVNLEIIDIAEYKQQLSANTTEQFRENILNDMQWRLENKLPDCTKQPYRQFKG